MHQRQRADLRGDVGLDEHAAMAAGLGALRDDGVDAALGEKCASRRDVAELMILQPALLTRATSAASGNPKWKLTTAGANLFDHRAGRGGERHDRGLERKLRHLGAKLGVVGREAFEPSGVARLRPAGAVDGRRN